MQADLDRYPELAKEAALIEEALFLYATAQAEQPPTGLEQQIWDKIQAAGNSETAQPIEVKRPALVLPLSPGQRHTRFSYAAVWAALVGSMVLNTLFWYQNSIQKQQTVALNTRLDSMQANQQALANVVANYNKGKNMMADTSMETIVLHSVYKGHPMAATVYWSKGKAEAYVMMDALPEPPKGMQYQLWAMQGGKPVDMGVLPLEMASTPMIQKVGKAVASGEAFAISLEKQGGSPSPTMENIYVMGKS